ncbi:MAG: transposase, partial [Methanobrevibacter sp.]|jgi:transposase|nr:transposase [Methanobrevibacter sp.]
VFLDQTGYQNRCNSGKLWFKPELRKNIIIRNPDRFKINAFGSFSPNGNSILQFRKTSKSFDIMTFLCETRKVNLNDENIAYELELLLTRYYNTQKNIVNHHNSLKYYDKNIKNYLIENKIEKIKNKINNLGKPYEILFQRYYTLLIELITKNITKNEIFNAKILKKEYDKRSRIQKEIKLAKKLIHELDSNQWLKKFKNEKKITLILDNARIHRAILTKTIAKFLKIDLIYLPKYASDLNPIERVWYSIKDELSKNYVENINYLKDHFELYFNKFTQSKTLAREFLLKFII